MLKVVPKRKWRYPLSLEREYSKYLVSYVEKNMDIVKQFLPDMEELLLVYGLQADAHVHMEVLMDRIHKAMVPPEKMRPVANAMSIRVDRYNQQEWDAIIKSVLGMPMSANGRIHQDSEADDALRELWVAENLDLIKSVDEQTMQRVKAMLQERIVGNVNRRELAQELAGEVERITGLEKNRALLIARDQVGKLNGRLMQYRQTHAGITEYKWSTSHDQRVRTSHRALDGRTFSWDSPPAEGHPGTPIRCRCVALPVIDLDKVVTKPVPRSYVQVENSVRNTSEGSIINTRGGRGLEQSKNRDRKILITDVAIDKVSCVDIPGVSESISKAIQEEHKNILRISMKENKSNEVLTVWNYVKGKKIRVFGSENYVNPVASPEAFELFRSAEKNEIMYLHNHPSTKKISFSDIMEFIRFAQIGMLSVVTNQGEVYILRKGSKYNFKEIKAIFNEIYQEYAKEYITDEEAVERFLKNCSRGGIIYARTR